jgi:hypothetical protein
MKASVVVILIFSLSLAVVPLVLAQDTESPAESDVGILIHEAPVSYSPSRQRATEGVTIAASASAFVGFVRWPAEGLCSGPAIACLREMENNTAYFRDFFTGGRTLAAATHDAEQWYAQATDPSGNSRTWPSVTFHAVLPGVGLDCFVGGGLVLCDRTSVLIDWYTGSQCSAGNWTMRFFDDAAEFANGLYVIEPILPPGTTPAWNQGAAPPTFPGPGPFPYDSMCRALDLDENPIDVWCHPDLDLPPNTLFRYKIQTKGCLLVSYAEVLRYHGVALAPGVDPILDLNRWLVDNDGYSIAGLRSGQPDSGGSIDPFKIPFYAAARGVSNMRFVGRFKGADLDTRNQLCGFGPQAIEVLHAHPSGPTHWAPATGYPSAAKDDLFLADPNGGVADRRFQAYAGSQPNANTIASAPTRVLSGPHVTIPDRSGLWIVIHSPAHMVVTDPAGRKSGFDATSGLYFDEIPGGGYDAGGLGDLDTGTAPTSRAKVFELAGPAPGEYQFDLTGTADGTYTLEMRAYDQNGQQWQTAFRELAILPGEKHTYSLSYEPQPGITPNVTGGFDGGGQRPVDVNKFLSYIKPTLARTKLPSGTTSYALTLYYGSSVIPATFSATLNGLDISPRFTPTAGTWESVTLDLQPGSNVLRLSVEGTVGTRTATDTDRLVFNVQ